MTREEYNAAKKMLLEQGYMFGYMLPSDDKSIQEFLDKCNGVNHGKLGNRSTNGSNP
jgi:hypothetical protein